MALTNDQIARMGELYRAGILSDREIAAQFQVSHPTVGRHARKLGWTRGELSQEVRARTQDKLIESAASDFARPLNDVPAANQRQHTHTRALIDGDARNVPVEHRECTSGTSGTRLVLDSRSDAEIVEDAAEVSAMVVRIHRRDIQAARLVAGSLLGELAKATESIDEIEGAIIEDTQDDESSTRRQAMLKAVSLPARVGVIRDLATAMQRLQQMERVAYNIDDDDKRATGSYEDQLRELEQGGSGQ